VVASTYADSRYLQSGTYKIKQRDLPLYEVDDDTDGRMVVKQLQEGVETGCTNWRILTEFTSKSGAVWRYALLSFGRARHAHRPSFGRSSHPHPSALRRIRKFSGRPPVR